MRFIINDLVFDTDKMELICDRAKKWIKNNTLSNMLGGNVGNYYDSKLWKSKKGNYLLTTEYDNGCRCAGEMISEEKVKEILKKYSYEDYVKVFGELEEA